MKVDDYLILEAENNLKLMKFVNDCLKGGYVLLGGPWSVATQTRVYSDKETFTDYRFYQAMVRPAKEAP